MLTSLIATASAGWVAAQGFGCLVVSEVESRGVIPRSEFFLGQPAPQLKKNPEALRLLSLANQAATKLDSRQSASLLIEIARVQARAGDVAGALKLASSLKSEEPPPPPPPPPQESLSLPSDDARNQAIAYIAVKQAEAGDIAGAVATAKPLQGLEEPNRRWTGYANGGIAYFQAKVGDLAGALKAAESLKDGSGFKAVCSIAGLQHRSGNHEQAFKILSESGAVKSALASPAWSHLLDPATASGLLRRLSEKPPSAMYEVIGMEVVTSVSRLSRQFPPSAFDEFDQFDLERLFSPPYPGVLGLIVAEKASHGDREGADRLVPTMINMVKSPPIMGLGIGSDEVEAMIVGGLVDGDDPEDAVKVASSFPESRTKSRVWAMIVRAQAQADDFQVALKSQRNIDAARYQCEAASALASAYFRKGDVASAEKQLAGAMQRLSAVKEPRDRAAALAKVAKAQWDMGRREDAAATLREADALKDEDGKTLGVYEIDVHVLLGALDSILARAVDSDQSWMVPFLCQAEAGSGNLAQAVKAAEVAISRTSAAESSRNDELRMLFRVVGRTGDAKRAEAMAMALPDAERRALSLLGVAEGLLDRESSAGTPGNAPLE